MANRKKGKKKDRNRKESGGHGLGNPSGDQSLELAASAVKQVITLSTLVIGGMILLADRLFTGEWEWLLKTSWAVFLASIFFGIFALLAVVDHARGENRSISPGLLRGYVVVQVLLFFGGLVLTVWFGWVTL